MGDAVEVAVRPKAQAARLAEAHRSIGRKDAYELATPGVVFANGGDCIRPPERKFAGDEYVAVRCDRQVEWAQLSVVYEALGGQKTGAFLDQRENYAAAEKYARGEALDVFCYQGGFALHLARTCEKITGVDSSRPALEMAEKNAGLNGQEIEWIEANAFDLLRDYSDQGKKYDCIVLDISLPNGNGLDILKQIKKLNKPDGVLIISARISLDDKVTGLELGADDYLTKPFHLAELSSRINAIVRRRSFEGNNTLLLDRLQVNIADKSVRTENGPVELTRKEYALLLYFLANKGKVVSKNAIAEHLWGDGIDMANNFDFIYSHIKNIRKKLSAYAQPDWLETVRGLGYKIKIN